MDEEYRSKSVFLTQVRQHAQISHKVFLEVGTGWHPVLPIFLQLLGARSTTTIDLNPWLVRSALLATLSGFEVYAPRIAVDFGIDEGELEARLRPMLAAAGDGSVSVAEILRQGGIEYRVPCNACATNLPPQSVDFIVSYNVLEHLPVEVIRGMLAESQRILRADGVHLHHINPGDHYASDSNITASNFLRYSPFAWYFIGGSGLAYHNRLRDADYSRLIHEASFRVAHEDRKIDDRALAAIRSGAFKVDRRFEHYSAESLACTVLDIFAIREEKLLSRALSFNGSN
jgi:hypothetical protein